MTNKARRVHSENFIKIGIYPHWSRFINSTNASLLFYLISLFVLISIYIFCIKLLIEIAAVATAIKYFADINKNSLFSVRLDFITLLNVPSFNKNNIECNLINVKFVGLADEFMGVGGFEGERGTNWPQMTTQLQFSRPRCYLHGRKL